MTSAGITGTGGIGFVGNGTTCFTGTRPQALSLGMTYDF